MAGHKNFFSERRYAWNNYSEVRSKYYEGLPVPQAEYFKPIRSIDECAEVIARPIYNPLWFAAHTALFFLKAVLSLVATVLLLFPTILLAVIAPNSQLFGSTIDAFKVAAADTVVAGTMDIIAACGTLASLVLNPLYVLTRGFCTVVDKLNDITEATVGLTIAKL